MSFLILDWRRVAILIMTSRRTLPTKLRPKNLEESHNAARPQSKIKNAVFHSCAVRPWGWGALSHFVGVLSFRSINFR